MNNYLDQCFGISWLADNRQEKALILIMWHHMLSYNGAQQPFQIMGEVSQVMG